MARAEILKPNGSLSFQAALELWTAVYAVYGNRQASLQALLNATGGGSVLLWIVNPTAIHVDVAVCRQGERYLIVFAGTTNKAQMFGNIIGGAAGLYRGGGVFANSFFMLLWEGVRRAVLNELPSPSSSVRITVTGHSLGGAVGQLASNDLAEIFGAGSVDLLAFAQPKALTVGYVGPSPATYIRLCRYGDPVPWIPPRIITTLWAPFAALGVPTTGTSLLWQHYGDGWLLREDGSLTEDPGEYLGGWLDLYRSQGLFFDAHSPVKTAQVFVAGAARA